jgi:hypothetical protein
MNQRIGPHLVARRLRDPHHFLDRRRAATQDIQLTTNHFPRARTNLLTKFPGPFSIFFLRERARAFSSRLSQKQLASWNLLLVFGHKVF